MRSLPLPTDNDGTLLDAITILHECCSNITKGNLKIRLEQAAETIAIAVTDYENRGPNKTFHEIEKIEMIDTVNRDEMVWTYTNKLSKSGHPARRFYDRILNAPQWSKCPYCAARNASQLDHYLDKTIYPVFALSPSNLVPSCKDCNFAKKGLIPSTATEVFLHPYYDNIQNGIWLHGRILETNPVSIEYYVAPPQTWGGILSQRIINYFNVLNLAKIYSDNAAEEFTSIRATCQGLFLLGDDNLRHWLTDHIPPDRPDLHNSWKIVFYKSLSESEWFLRGGVNL